MTDTQDTATDLPSPAYNLTVKYVAVGHGIQNYTCASSDASAVATGALAVLYDITPLYPGTPTTGLSADAFDALSSTVLWGQAIPLNLADPSAAAGNATTETAYQADAADPFPSPAADLSLGSSVSAKFLGHHYFDASSSPTFDLSGAGSGSGGMLLSGAKTGDVKAPGDADAGILDTGAVDWLQLGDSGRGLSEGLSVAYRVVTAGGAAQACAVSGASAEGEVLSVPYAAQYWFYG